MPIKSRSGPAAPSKQSVRSKSSRSVGKRARAEVQERDIQVSSKAGAHEDGNQTNEALQGNGTRLKKKRLSEPVGMSPKYDKGEADARESEASLSTAIQSVANRCEQQIERILQDRIITRPKLDLIHDIVLILQKASAVRILSSVPNLPKILFIATQMGVEEEDGASCATTAVVEALIHIAKVQTEDLPTFSAKKRRVRSAFTDDTYVDYTEMQIEAAKKAGKWALELLSNCVRGVSDAVGGSQHDNYRNQLQHADMSELFVLPRDKLDPLLAGRLVESSALSLQNTTCVKQYPSEVPRCPKLSDAQLTVALSHPLCSSLLDQLLLNAEKTYTSCVKRSSVKESLDFLTKVGQGVIQAGEQAFLALLPPSQMILLRHCKKVRLWHRHSLELALLSSDNMFSSKDTRGICAPFAKLIACDVALHWDLMDEVRREISRQSEPFNLLSWRLRPFYRAVFAEALCLIRSETVSGEYKELSHSSIVPLSKRFPTFFRSVVGFLATADKSFVPFERNPEDAYKTAVLTLKILQRFLSGRCGTYQISASMQAFLLCVEGILERMSWTCAIGVALALSHETSSEHEWKQVTEDLAVVICCIEVFRLPGGGSAETEETINRRIREVRSFLLNVVVKKCLKVSRKPERPRVNGLLAFWLTGLVSAGVLDGFSEAVKVIDRFEVLEILRSLEIVSKWCHSKSSRERCNSAVQILEKVRKK